jgi:hypothetical protein
MHRLNRIRVVIVVQMKKIQNNINQIKNKHHFTLIQIRIIIYIQIYK